MISKHQLTYGTTVIPFSIKYSDRKTMAISVYPDRRVEVTSPLKAPIDKVIAKVEKRASWILKKISMYSRRHIFLRKHEWVSGESIYYLGRQYRLKVVQGNPEIKLAGKFLIVSVKDKRKPKLIKELVESWYRRQAKIKYTDVLKKNEPILIKEKIKMNQLMIRKFEKRWGSCSDKGNIILNIDLVKTPVDCINYVVVHELCHLKHLNHNRNFYRTLERHIPEWRKTKAKLEHFISLI